MKTNSNDKIVQFCARIDAAGVYHAPEQPEQYYFEPVGEDYAEPIWEDSSALTCSEALAQLRQQLALLIADSTVACRLAQAEREAINAQLVAADGRLNHVFDVHHDLVQLLRSMDTPKENQK